MTDTPHTHPHGVVCPPGWCGSDGPNAAVLDRPVLVAAATGHTRDDCEGRCIGCGGSGIHPFAGQPDRGARSSFARYDSDEKCSWCEGDGSCDEHPPTGPIPSIALDEVEGRSPADGAAALAEQYPALVVSALIPTEPA
jgi:hypothetical protein